MTPDSNEVTSEAVIMRTLPFPRFRTAFHEKVVLPETAAKSLEDLELAMRKTGLIASNQFFVQTLKDPLDFRVHTINFIEPVVLV